MLPRATRDLHLELPRSWQTELLLRKTRSEATCGSCGPRGYGRIEPAGKFPHLAATIPKAEASYYWFSKPAHPSSAWPVLHHLPVHVLDQLLAVRHQPFQVLCQSRPHLGSIRQSRGTWLEVAGQMISFVVMTCVQHTSPAWFIGHFKEKDGLGIDTTTTTNHHCHRKQRSPPQTPQTPQTPPPPPPPPPPRRNHKRAAALEPQE